MSGICGLVKADAPVSREDMEALLAPLAKTGPGKAGFALAGNVGVGYFDRFGDGEGCLHEDEAVLVVCDAELYNHRDLAGEGAFSEAALIASLYRKHGIKWSEPVVGVYAAFIWDKKSRMASVYSDRVGVRPIVYGEGGPDFCASTSVLSVAARKGSARGIDPQAVFCLLQMEVVPTPYTIFRGVRKLEAGHALVHADGRVREERLWDQAYPTAKLTDVEEMKESALGILSDAVRLQMDYRGGEAETGCFLSGGIDSSTIAGLADRLHPGGSRTFSIGFDEPGYDEMEFARIAAKAFRTRHTEYYVTSADVVDALPSIVAAYDEPFANSSVIPAYFCARLGREQGMRTLMGGDGGDEIFGGNARYHEILSMRSRVPPWLAGPLWALVGGLHPETSPGPLRKLRAYLSRTEGPMEERMHAYSISDYLESSRIFSREFLASGPFKSPSEISGAYVSRVRGVHPLDQYMYHDLKLTLMDNDLRKVCRMTALAGVRARFPFLDHRLVELTGRIPPELKVKDGRLRHLFKEAAAGLLPREILAKTKHGFGIPVSRWMMRPGKLNEMAREALFGKSLEERGVFRKGFPQELYRRAEADGGAYYGIYLYYLIFFELWMREHVDLPARPLPASTSGDPAKTSIPKERKWQATSADA